MGQDLFNLNLYSYTLINGCFEMAGVLLIMFSINWIGRRASMMGGLFLCGVSLALCQVFERKLDQRSNYVISFRHLRCIWKKIILFEEIKKKTIRS